MHYCLPRRGERQAEHHDHQKRAENHRKIKWQAFVEQGEDHHKDDQNFDKCHGADFLSPFPAQSKKKAGQPLLGYRPAKMLLRSALVLLSGLLLSRQQVDSVLRAVGRTDGAAPALVRIVVHLAVVVLVERTEVANLRALAAVDALVLVPVDLPVGFGIDETGAGLIPSLLPPVLRRVLRRDGDGQKGALHRHRGRRLQDRQLPVRERAPHFKRYDPI